jgi:hypothetical protein
MDPASLTHVGRYRLEHPIGSGGMAVAYKASLDGPSGFAKPVLIKMLQPEHRASSHYYGMFLDEARLCSRLQHANIPHVFELDEVDELPYLVMEFVDGPNLVMLHRKFRDGHRRHFGHLAFIFAGVARALHYAHTLKGPDGKPLRIVHRDVSLANILISRDGVPKLIDFGIAKWEQSESVTEHDVLKGKLRYMAPEQFDRKPLDGRVDIYQLGVAMYWLLTGKPPFGNSAAGQELLARFETMPPKPSTLIHGFPAALEKIVMRCLEPNPDRRQASAAELADELDAFIRSDPAYASSADGVAAWIGSLFPGKELDLYLARGATAATGPGAGSRGSGPVRPRTGPIAGGGTRAGTREIPPQATAARRIAARVERISPTQWIGLAVIALLTALLYVQVSKPRIDVDALLDRAEASIDEKNFLLARTALARVERVGELDPDMEERAMGLQARLEQRRALEEARLAMQGGDLQSARVTLMKLLSEVPGDVEGRSLMTELQARLSGSAPTAPPPAGSAPIAPPPAGSAPIALPPAGSAPIAAPPAGSAPIAPPPAGSAPIAPPPAGSAPTAPSPAPSAPAATTPGPPPPPPSVAARPPGGRAP